MTIDQSACSGRLLPYGPAFGAAMLVAAGASLYGCGGGDNNDNGRGATPDGGSHDGSLDAEVGIDVGNHEAGQPDADGGGDGAATGSGQIGTLAKVANDPSFTSPFDATPSPDGSTIFFTAIGSDGTGAVFSAPARGGAVARLDPGGILVTPSGIATSADGTQLYVADPAADDDTLGKYGAIFVVPASGGAPAVLPGTQGVRPRGVAVAGTHLYYTGQDPLSGGAGVYSIALAGGQPTAVATGAPFVDPGGVTVAQNGDVYVADTFASASRLAAVIRISAGQATTIVSDIGVGYPAGIALSQDESAVLVSGLDPATQTDVVYRAVLGAAPQVSAFNRTISTFGEPAGLHRAVSVDVYAWADSRANGTGTVYALSK